MAALPVALWLGAPVLALLLSALAAWLVLRAAPERAINRRLAAVLAVEAVQAAVIAHGVLIDTGVIVEGVVIQPIVLLVSAALIVAYMAFLAQLPTPLVAPLRSRVFFASVAIVASVPAVLTGLAAFRPELAPLAQGLQPFAFLTLVLVAVWGLVAAISAWRRAELGSYGREQARAFALAFGVRDAGWGIMIASAVIPPLAGEAPLGGMLWTVMPNIVVIAYVPLLAYGVLRHRLFDIDVRLRWGIERGTVGAAFIIVYLLVSETTRALIAPSYGVPLGIAAAGALMLAIVPLQRWAERLAATLLPPDEDAYTHKRMEVYLGALREAHEATGGALSREDDARLAGLRKSLALTDRDHAALLLALRVPPAAPATGSLREGAHFGRFRIVRLLGEGGLGRTYLAEDTRLSRRVALKVLHDAGDAILEEARAMARVRHPNVVTLLDAGSHAGLGYLVMELADRGSLRDSIARGPIERAQADRIARDLLSALSAVHEAGLVHRDVKPGNVLLFAGGEAKLADFGVADLPGLETTRGGASAGAVGTVRFMSPEQARGRRAGPRSDLYSAALTLFEAYTGRALLSPQTNESAVELQQRAARGVRYPAEGCGDARLDAWFVRALAHRPEERFPTAGKMRDAFDAIRAPGRASLAAENEHRAAHADDVAG